MSFYISVEASRKAAENVLVAYIGLSEAARGESADFTLRRNDNNLETLPLRGYGGRKTCARRAVYYEIGLDLRRSRPARDRREKSSRRKKRRV